MSKALNEKPNAEPLPAAASAGSDSEWPVFATARG